MAAVCSPVTTAAPPEPPQGRVGLSRTPTATSYRPRGARARPVRPARTRSSAGRRSIAVTLLARSCGCGTSASRARSLFDETYYAKDAWSLLHHGYVRDYVDKANEQILAGRPRGLWKPTARDGRAPRGRQVADRAGREGVRDDPFGWRVASAVVGALMVLVMIRLARRVTGSTLLGCVAGLLLCFDGLHFVLSRLALLDIFVAFFVLCAVACMVADRDWGRARLARLVPDRVDAPRPGGRCAAAVAAVAARRRRLLGLAIGTKWNALFPLAAFGLLVWFWDAGARRSFGVRRPVLRSPRWSTRSRRSCYVVLVPFVVYVASWTGWLLHADAVRGAPLRHAVRPLLGQGWRPHRAGRRRVPRRADRSRCARCGTTTTTSTPSTPASSTTARTSTRPTRRAGCCSTVRWASTPRSTSSPAPRAATRPRAATACARCCCSAPRWCGGSASLALLFAAGAWVGAPGLALRRSWSSASRRPGCRGCSTTTGRSSASTRSSMLPFIGPRADAGHRASCSARSTRPVDAAHGRRRSWPARSWCWCC